MYAHKPQFGSILGYCLPCRYLKIIKEEGLEISQPALDPNISEVHHHLTARDSRSKVHRFPNLFQENYVSEWSELMSHLYLFIWLLYKFWWQVFMIFMYKCHMFCHFGCHDKNYLALIKLNFSVWFLLIQDYVVVGSTLVNRKINKLVGGGRKCDANSTDPPCTG